jgi:hypothetical protein
VSPIRFTEQAVWAQGECAHTNTNATVSLSSVPITYVEQVLQHADASKPPTTAPSGIVDAAQQGCGKTIQQDARHHVRVQEHDRRKPSHAAFTALIADAARPHFQPASIHDTRI